MTIRSHLLILLLGIIALLSREAFGSVLAIDYGADWIKASLMKPGIPFDVLLNRDSKRKIQASVGWKGDDRVFGGDAANAVCNHTFNYYIFIQPHLVFRRLDFPKILSPPSSFCRQLLMTKAAY
jgi:molecular chaperone DnaK (HSP70)